MLKVQGISCACITFESLQRLRMEFWYRLEADETTICLFGGYRCRPAAHERVKCRRSLLRRQSNQEYAQVKRLLCFMDSLLVLVLAGSESKFCLTNVSRGCAPEPGLFWHGNHHLELVAA